MTHLSLNNLIYFLSRCLSAFGVAPAAEIGRLIDLADNLCQMCSRFHMNYFHSNKKYSRALVNQKFNKKNLPHLIANSPD